MLRCPLSSGQGGTATASAFWVPLLACRGQPFQIAWRRLRLDDDPPRTPITSSGLDVWLGCFSTTANRPKTVLAFRRKPALMNQWAHVHARSRREALWQFGFRLWAVSYKLAARKASAQPATYVSSGEAFVNGQPRSFGRWKLRLDDIGVADQSLIPEGTNPDLQNPRLAPTAHRSFFFPTDGNLFLRPRRDPCAQGITRQQLTSTSRR